MLCSVKCPKQKNINRIYGPVRIYTFLNYRYYFQETDIINGISPKRSCVQQIIKYTYNNAIRSEPIEQE